MKIKAVLFSRVSTREQAEEGYSLQAQERLIKEYADRSNFDVVKRFSVPESASGKQERKLFNELLEYLQNHTEIKVVICEKVDRITRNFKDAVKLDDWLNADETRQIHFVKQNLIIHKNAKSNEKFMWDIYLAMARQYSNNLSEETKKGLFEKADQGWFPGNHKRGYKSVGDIGHKTWFIDDSNLEAKYITKAFEHYDTGNYTLRTLTKELFTQGWISSTGKPISTSELHKLLVDSFYCGEFIWHGKKYQGKHNPLVSKDLFYSVQDRLQRKIKAGKYRKHSFVLGGGLMVCEGCNRTVTWETQKGHNYGHARHAESCPNKFYIREEKVQEQIIEILNNFKITNQRLLDWVRKALKESHRSESDYHSNTMNELEERRLQVEKRLDTLYDERLDGKITKDFYDRKQVQYQAELEAVIDAITKHAKANIDYFKLGINIFELSQQGGEIYQRKAITEEKREFLNFVFLNLKLKNEKVIPTLQNGFEVVALRAKNQDWLPLKDLFINRELEFGQSSDELKILFATLNLPTPTPIGYA